MNTAIKYELLIFLIVGFITVGIDFLLYRWFIYFQPFGLSDINTAKGFGFGGGALFAYFANRFWTFNQQKTISGCVFRFIVVYIFNLVANITFNFLGVKWFSNYGLPMEYTLLFAFILATGISATMNFIGMKFFVFTNPKPTNL